MVNVTVSMSEQTVRRLRKVVREVYGSRKGTLSSIVESAINETLDRRSNGGKTPMFRAMKGNDMIAEAADLQALADILRQKGLDPRGMRIVSTSPLSPTARIGPRGSYR